MTLRGRVALSTALLAVMVVFGFSVLAYWLFVTEQERHLHAVLRQDLMRVSLLLDNPLLGASFPESTGTSFILQFVAPGDRLVMSWGRKQLLPEVANIQRLELDGRTFLVATAPWPATSGTIRLAHDISSALSARADLSRTLVVSGLLVAFAAVLLALVAMRGSLMPLLRVAQQARELDPRSPRLIEYKGPNDELGNLTNALNGALEAIRTRQEEERMFLVEIAHELAAPLTLVDYHLSDVIVERPGDDRLQAASGAARELLRTSQDLLVLARGELEFPLSLQVLDLREILDHVASEYPGVKRNVGYGLEVVGDRERLTQVVRNLVRNGIQASGTAAKVCLSTRSEAGVHVIEVRDEGPGMAPEIIGRIFERLYSASGRGVGVGLTIAKSLVERHDGELRVHSTIGEGTVFELLLPSLEARLESGAV